MVDWLGVLPRGISLRDCGGFLIFANSEHYDLG
jgi:hypothetical protein